MSNTTISPSAAWRTRTLSTPLPVHTGTDASGRGTGPTMSYPSANVPVHNSIALPQADASAHTGARDFGAKQAAPPRGLSR